MKKLVFFPYMGGKFYMANYIVKLIPEHGVYVEPFCGSAKVLFAKEPSKIEIINDYDKKIANLFYVVMFKFDKFYEKISRAVYSKDLFLDFREKVRNYNMKKLGDVDYAVYVYYLLCLSISCNMSVFATSKSISGGNRAQAFFNKVKNLPLIHNRLKNVIIENMDFEEIIRKYDSREAFFYIDPPYFGAKRYYQQRFIARDHERLLKLLKRINGKWLLSGYGNDLYNTSLEGYYKLEIERTKFSFVATHKLKEKTKPRAIEILWANYDIGELARLNDLKGVRIYDKGKELNRKGVFSIDSSKIVSLF